MAKRHTITQLYKKDTIHRVITSSELSTVVKSLKEAMPSLSAGKTLLALTEQTTQIGRGEFTLPVAILTRVITQMELRQSQGVEFPHDESAKDIIRSKEKMLRKGPEVVRAKLAYLQTVLANE